jgi:hypothetical protein
MLGSKATTGQKLGRNQYDENTVYTGHMPVNPFLVGWRLLSGFWKTKIIYILYTGIRTMVLCLPNRSLVLLSDKTT